MRMDSEKVGDRLKNGNKCSRSQRGGSKIG